MKTLPIFTFLALFIHPISIKANTVKGISDFDGSFTGIERVDFECPSTNERRIRTPNEEFETLQVKKNCWVDFHSTYLNVMDKQIINRTDVIKFFQSPPASGKCCASWNLIYRDHEGKSKMLSMRRDDLPFPLTKRKLKRLGTPANIINRWLAQ
mgnify:FL=1